MVYRALVGIIDDIHVPVGKLLIGKILHDMPEDDRHGPGVEHHLGAHGGQPAVSREQGIIEITGAGDDGRDRYRFQGQGLFLVDRGQFVADDLEGDGIDGKRFVQCVPVGNGRTQYIIVFTSHYTLLMDMPRNSSTVQVCPE